MSARPRNGTAREVEELPSIALHPSPENDLYLVLTGGAAATRRTLEALGARGERYARSEEGRRFSELLGLGGPWGNRLQAGLLALAERAAKEAGGEMLPTLDLGLGLLDRLRRDPTIHALSRALRGPDPGFLLLGLLSLGRDLGEATPSAEESPTAEDAAGAAGHPPPPASADDPPGQEPTGAHGSLLR